ncbi:MAG: hypothetical protein D6160_11655 [Ketobacter sp.]|nr:MAG: hypothetical protein D6160_11655 [Ketobacter sp.]
MRVFTFLVCFIVFNECAYSYCGDLPVISTTNSEGKKIGIVLSGNMIKNTPSWSPVEEEPPLSVQSASVKLLGWLKKNYPNYDGVKINKIALNYYECSGYQDKWYYLFEYSFIENGNELFGIANWVAALMDGSIVDVSTLGNSN